MATYELRESPAKGSGRDEGAASMPSARATRPAVLWEKRWYQMQI